MYTALLLLAISFSDDVELPTRTPPPAAIPNLTADMKAPKLVYLHGRNAYHLRSRTFFVWLGDYPKALLMRTKADFLSLDDDFYYYRDEWMQHQWAFARNPEDNFLVERTVWTRPTDQSPWQIHSCDATVATPSSR